MMARTSFPLGFRFYPTDVELVMYHLKRKLMGKNAPFEVISELNIYNYSPWDLPDKSCWRSKDLEWYFFCPKVIKYANGARMERATDCGYWKSTGKDRHVSYEDRTVAMVKTLVFHKGHSPKGERTDWVMHEFRMLDKELSDAGVQDAYVLCKVFQKSGVGPQNGAQYGAPFNEDDYDDDGEICAEVLLPVALPPPALPSDNSVFLPGSTSSGSGPLGCSIIFQGSTSSGPLGGSVIFPGSTSSGPLPDSAFVPGSTASWTSSSVFVPGSTSSGPLSDPGPSKALLGADKMSPPIPDNSDDIGPMLDMCREDDSRLPCENGKYEVENFGHVNQNEGLACLDGNDISNDAPMLALNDLYVELDDFKDFTDYEVENFGHVSENEGLACPDENDIFNGLGDLETERGLTPRLALDNSAYLELNDLKGPIGFPAENPGSEYFFGDSIWGP